MEGTAGGGVDAVEVGGGGEDGWGVEVGPGFGVGVAGLDAVDEGCCVGRYG